jgi:hypothetical protein
MNKLQLLQMGLLVSTAQHYNHKNLGRKTNGSCSYEAGCAVGRLISNKELCKKLDDRDSSSVSDVFSRLPKSVQKYGKSFLADLQKLHDNDSHWDNKGLTVSGLRTTQEIAEQILNGKSYALDVIVP